jgi:type I restriction enzyme R subunit
LRALRDQDACDLYDVLAELAYGAAARSRAERAAAFAYKQRQWLKGLPGKAEPVLIAMARQFERGGIEELETPSIFDAQQVKDAGGFAALTALTIQPADVIIETKTRLLAP